MHTPFPQLAVNTYTHHAQAHTHTQMHTHTSTGTYTQTHTHKHRHAQAHTHTRTHTQMHTHAHTHTHCLCRHCFGPSPVVSVVLKVDAARITQQLPPLLSPQGGVERTAVCAHLGAQDAVHI